MKKTIYLGENNKKYVTFTIPIEKQLQKLIKIENRLQKMSYRLQPIDSARFIANLLSVINNTSEGMHKMKCKLWN